MTTRTRKKEPMLAKLSKTKKLFTITCIFIYEELIVTQNDDHHISGQCNFC